MLARDWMTHDIVTVGIRETLHEASNRMVERHVSMLPVTDNGNLVGIVTDRDIKHAKPSHLAVMEVKHILYHMTRVEVGAIMTPNPITISPDYTVEETAEILLENKISGAPVVDNEGKLVGVITKSDLFRALISVTGLKTRGVQFGLLVRDRPGSIREITDIVRHHNGRIVSILTSYDRAPEGFRHLYVRAFEINRDALTDIKEKMSERADLIYVVDHRENKREIMADPVVRN